MGMKATEERVEKWTKRKRRKKRKTDKAKQRKKMQRQQKRKKTGMTPCVVAAAARKAVQRVVMIQVVVGSKVLAARDQQRRGKRKEQMRERSVRPKTMTTRNRKKKKMLVNGESKTIEVMMSRRKMMTMKVCAQVTVRTMIAKMERTLPPTPRDIWRGCQTVALVVCAFSEGAERKAENPPPMANLRSQTRERAACFASASLRSPRDRSR